MPGRNGFEIIEEMKRNPSLARTEVILITGTHFEEELKKQHESQVCIRRKGGLPYTQVLACLRALVNVFGDEKITAQEIAGAAFEELA
jgi:CheY-like chemotaxis protein